MKRALHMYSRQSHLFNALGALVVVIIVLTKLIRDESSSLWMTL